VNGAAPDRDRRHTTADSAAGYAERQVPFYCPYCGDEDLRPYGPDVGGWQCGSCARAFRLRFSGVARPAWDAP
jgi:transposase-like protein